MDRGAWWAIVYGATKLDTTIHACTVALRVPGGLGLNPLEHTGGGLVARSCLTLAAPNSHSKKSVKWVNEFQLCSCKFRFSAFSHLDSTLCREMGF